MKFLSIFCALWFALMAGFFYAYSVTVMPAFAAGDPRNSMEAMQVINANVQNAQFAVGFFGALAIALLGILYAIYTRLNDTTFLLLGCAVYLAGSFAVTLAGNVPMNRALASLDPNQTAALTYWSEYLVDWTALNHLRTLASLLAAALVLAPFVIPVRKTQIETA